MKTLIYQIERWSISVVLLLLLLCFSNCDAPVKLLTSTFESDQTGQLPNKSLPGNPAGDEITYATGIEDQLEVVPGSGGSAKALLYRGNQVTGNTPEVARWLSFRGAPFDFQKPVTFRWTARRNFPAPGANLLIDISDGASGPLVRILVDQDEGKITLVQNLGTNAGEIIGGVGNNEVHTFVLSVDVAAGKYYVQVYASGNTYPSNSEKTLLSTNVSSNARPQISFKYSNYISSYHYTIEEVFITRKKN